MRELPFDPDIMESFSGQEVEGLGLEILERIRVEVDGLPEPERSVVEMVVWGRFSKAETGRRLGYSRSHVRTLWNRAKTRLEERLGDVFGED